MAASVETYFHQPSPPRVLEQLDQCQKQAKARNHVAADGD
jgi:hypothetical protein